MLHFSTNIELFQESLSAKIRTKAKHHYLVHVVLTPTHSPAMTKQLQFSSKGPLQHLLTGPNYPPSPSAQRCPAQKPVYVFKDLVRIARRQFRQQFIMCWQSAGDQHASPTRFLRFRFFFSEGTRQKKVISQKMDSIFHLSASLGEEEKTSLFFFVTRSAAQSNQLMGRKSLHFGMRVRFKCAAPGATESFSCIIFFLICFP